MIVQKTYTSKTSLQIESQRPLDHLSFDMTKYSSQDVN